MESTGQIRRFDGVIFDMDGTLIEPLIDFAAIRAELGIDPRCGILESIEAMPDPARQKAHQYLLTRELSAAREAKLTPGAAELSQAIRRAGLKTALLTRNTQEAVQIVLQRFGQLEFDLSWSREDGPIKPEPDGILRPTRALGIDPARTACVGDFHYDITAANAAGAVSILLLRTPGAQRPDYADQADYVIEHLQELQKILGI